MRTYVNSPDAIIREAKCPTNPNYHAKPKSPWDLALWCCVAGIIILIVLQKVDQYNPRASSGSGPPVAATLQTLRGQIELFKIQHVGHPPACKCPRRTPHGSKSNPGRHQHTPTQTASSALTSKTFPRITSTANLPSTVPLAPKSAGFTKSSATISTSKPSTPTVPTSSRND